MCDPDVDKRARCICRDLQHLTEQDRKNFDSQTPTEVFLSLMSSVLFTDKIHPPSSPPSLAT